MTAIGDRFRGDIGRGNLIDAMMQQAMVGGNRDLAAEIADRIELLEVTEGETLITQGADDNDLFLIIAGAFKIEVNGRDVAMRGRGDHVGEMALIEPTQRRSASVVATEGSLVGKLTHDGVTELTAQHPEIYRALPSAPKPSQGD